MNRFFFSAVFLCLGIEVALAQKMEVSLQQAQDYALTNNASIRVGQLELQSAKHMLWQSISAGLPQVMASGGYTDNLALPAQFFDINQDGVIDKLQFGTKYNSIGSLGVQQLVFDGSYVVGLLATQVVQKAAENAYEKTTLEVREAVAQAYHLAIVTERNEKVVQENLRLTKQLHSDAQAMKDAGFIESSDVDQLAIVVGNLENSAAFLANQRSVIHALLTLQMGLSQATELVLTDGLEQLLLFTEEGSALLSAPFDVKNHLDYRNMTVQRQGAILTMQNEKMSFLPRVQFQYGLNQNFVSENANVWNPDFASARNVVFSSWGMNASVPLFTSGRRISRVKQAQIKLREVDILMAQTQDALSMQYQMSRAEYQFSLNQYFSYRRNEQWARSIRDKMYVKFKEGVSSSQEFTQAENQYQQSVTATLNAANQALNKRVALEKFLGKYNYPTFEKK